MPPALHWIEYACEAALLGAFMLVACVGAWTLEHPASPVHRAIRAPAARRALMGLLMGLAAVALINSPLAQRSGGHFNPATTLTFLWLGKIAPIDALAYILAQFLGGAAGVFLARAILGTHRLGHARVNYAITAPGRHGRLAAWIGEAALAFTLMFAVLLASNSPAFAPYTGLLAGALVALFILVEAPISGMSLNPARTLASAIPARHFRDLWVYFTAPPLAMLLAAFVYAAAFGADHVYCAKLNHAGDAPCIFRCRIDALRARTPQPGAPAGIQDARTPPPAEHPR